MNLEQYAAATQKERPIREILLADVTERLFLLQQQQKQLEAQQRAIADSITQLEAQRMALNSAGDADAAMTAALAFWKDRTPSKLQKVVTQGRDKPAIMGLLYGTCLEIERDEYAAGRYDLSENAEYQTLKAEIKVALEDARKCP